MFLKKITLKSYLGPRKKSCRASDQFSSENYLGIV
jgi:hypothetical protein